MNSPVRHYFQAVVCWNDYRRCLPNQHDVDDESLQLQRFYQVVLGSRTAGRRAAAVATLRTAAALLVLPSPRCIMVSQCSVSSRITVPDVLLSQIVMH